MPPNSLLPRFAKADLSHKCVVQETTPMQRLLGPSASPGLPFIHGYAAYMRAWGVEGVETGGGWAAATFWGVCHEHLPRPWCASFSPCTLPRLSTAPYSVGRVEAPRHLHRRRAPSLRQGAAAVVMDKGNRWGAVATAVALQEARPPWVSSPLAQRRATGRTPSTGPRGFVQPACVVWCALDNDVSLQRHCLGWLLLRRECRLASKTS